MKTILISIIIVLVMIPSVVVAGGMKDVVGHTYEGNGRTVCYHDFNSDGKPEVKITYQCVIVDKLRKTVIIIAVKVEHDFEFKRAVKPF